MQQQPEILHIVDIVECRLCGCVWLELLRSEFFSFGGKKLPALSAPHTTCAEQRLSVRMSGAFTVKACAVQAVRSASCIPQAKKVMDDMKAQGLFQHKFLGKHISNCELANGLAHNFASMSPRDVKLSVAKLMQADVVLPWPVRVQVTQKLGCGIMAELSEAAKEDPAFLCGKLGGAGVGGGKCRGSARDSA